MKLKKDIEVRLTIKSILLYENLSGKSFYTISGNDILVLLYCVVDMSNPELRMSYDTFQTVMMKNEKIAKNLLGKLDGELRYVNGLRPMDEGDGGDTDRDNQGPSEMKEIPKMTTFVSYLITHGLDINYVMNVMELWELPILGEALSERMKEDMVDKRFWSYLQLLPNMDSKKVKSPQELLPFEWEKDNKSLSNKDFYAENKDKILNIFKDNRL